MEMNDTQVSDVSSDTSAPEIQTDTTQALNVDSTQAQSQEFGQDEAVDAPKAPSPFAGGKEKFKVNGQEKEWDWNTTKKYAQLGYAGQQALEKAHATETKAKQSMQNLYAQINQLAVSDPEGLIRMFNPKYQGTSSRQMAAQGAQTEQGQTTEQGYDPRDQKIQELEQRTQSFEQMIEKQAVEEERKAIATEMEEAIKQYPELNSEINREYVKAQYKRALMKGIEGITIDDVAFHVSQKIKESKDAEVKAKQAQLQQNKQKAPVTAGSVGSTGGSTKPMSRADVMKLAGRQV